MNTTNTANVANTFSSPVAENKNNNRIEEPSDSGNAKFKEDMQKASTDRHHEKSSSKVDTTDKPQSKEEVASDSLPAKPAHIEENTNTPTGVEDEGSVEILVAEINVELLANTSKTPIAEAIEPSLLLPEVPSLVIPSQQGLADTLTQSITLDEGLVDDASAELGALDDPALIPINTTIKPEIAIISAIPTSDQLSALPLSSTLLSATKTNILAEHRLSQQLNETLDVEAGVEESTTTLLTPRSKMASAEPVLPNHTAPLNTSFTSARWGEAVTEKVMWMSARGLKEATIQLDPPELGQMTIKVGINQDQAQVSFTVQNSSVREALDSNALRLREMFAEDGLNLADVDVSDQSQSQDENETDRALFSQQDTDDTNDDADTHTQHMHQNYSLIDSYV